MISPVANRSNKNGMDTPLCQNKLILNHILYSVAVFVAAAAAVAAIAGPIPIVSPCNNFNCTHGYQSRDYKTHTIRPANLICSLLSLPTWFLKNLAIISFFII